MRSALLLCKGWHTALDSDRMKLFYLAGLLRQRNDLFRKADLVCLRAHDYLDLVNMFADLAGVYLSDTKDLVVYL